MKKKGEVPEKTAEEILQEFTDKFGEHPDFSVIYKDYAEKLIQRLDRFRANEPDSARQAALSTSVGLIFSWHTHKLSNLELALRKDAEIHGFITVKENFDDSLDIRIQPLTHPEDAERCETFEEVQALIGRIDEVLEVCQGGDDNGIDYKFPTQQSESEVSQ
jgi:hypothetical protein